MAFIFLYLILLMIAPQLWIEPFVGMRVDTVLYPLWILWAVATGRGREIIRLRAQDRFFLAFVLWMVLAALFGRSNENTGEIIFLYVKWFVLYRLVVVTLPSLRHVKLTLLMLLFIGMVLSVEGIQHMNDPNGVGWAGQSFAWMDDQAAEAGMKGRTRWVNIFDGPGVFCVIYTMALPVAMQLAMPPFKGLVRLGGAAMVVALLVATYFTGSRGGFLATVGMFGLFVLVRMHISVGRAMLAGGVMVAALVLAPSHLTSTSDSHHSAQHRIDMWAEGIEMVQYNPILGIGRGSFANYTGMLIAHNSGIEIMGEMGIPGLMLWLGMIYMAYRNIFAARSGSDDPFIRSYLIALALALAGYLMSALFVTLEYETFYFLLALAAAAGRHARTPPTFARRDFLIVLGMAIAFFAAIKTVVMMY